MNESGASAMSTNQDNPLADELRTRIPPEVPPRFQFGLFSMFLVTTAVAVTCSLTFSMPAEVAIPLFVLISVTLAAVLITVIMYGRSYQRTFCIGAVVPFGVLLLTLAFAGVILFLDGPSPRGNSLATRLVVVSFWASSLLIGGVCVGIRRLVERQPASPPDQGKIGPEAKTAVAALVELLRDKDENTRRAVAEALEKIRA